MADFPPAAVPRIAPVPPGVQRPFWSVMIPVYNRVTWLEQALRGVVAQFVSDEAVQIEVIDDCSPDLPDLAAIVARVGDGRVAVHRSSTRLGLVGNWNECLHRSRGQWIHLLHDDDYVLPGFYTGHRQAALANPQIGFSASGAALVEGDVSTPWPAIPAPPGIAPDWRGWLVFTNWLLMPSVVVRREAYETVGGFHPGLSHAADWEMWMRLASRFPLWLEPAVRACFRKHDHSETQRQARHGGNVVDIARALEIARNYLPPDQADSIVELSRESWAMGVINGMREVLRRGDIVTATNQYREAMALSSSPRVLRQTESGLMACFDEYVAEVEAAVNKLRAGTADAILIARLRDARRRVARQWLDLPSHQLQMHYEGDLGRVHHLLVNSGLASAPIDAADESLLHSLATVAPAPAHARLVKSLFAISS